jgi:nucleoside-diphosphate-sugar epimerase
MNCLVTGAAGFIGGSLVRRLVSEGHDVRGIIHHTQPTYVDTRVEYISGDITDPSFLQPAMDKIDVVFHCAAVVKDYGPMDVFERINVEGTKNLIAASEASCVKTFIFLSHIAYESGKNKGNYHTTKAKGEQLLMAKYTHDHFPVVIIRPGNVYGPGATTWVLRPLQAIQKNRIALIDKGTGIFLHTYIENLLDALVAAMQEPRAVGNTIDITDGDNTTTWADYLNAIAKMTGKPPITRNMSKRTALAVSKLMMVGYRLFKFEPWVTSVAVEIFTNQNTVSLKNAEDVLGYQPKVKYAEGLHHVERWLKTERYIP